MHPHLNAGDVAVEDRGGLRSEGRAGVEAALQDEQTILETDQGVTQIAPEAQADLLAVARLAGSSSRRSRPSDSGPPTFGRGSPAETRPDLDRLSRNQIRAHARGRRRGRASSCPGGRGAIVVLVAVAVPAGRCRRRFRSASAARAGRLASAEAGTGSSAVSDPRSASRRWRPARGTGSDGTAARGGWGGGGVGRISRSGGSGREPVRRGRRRRRRGCGVG